MTHSINITVMEQISRNNGLSNEMLRELFSRDDISTPTLLLSRSDIVRNYNRLKNAMPRVNIHYAIKPNNHETILEEVARRGGNFDVCSAGEIKLAKNTGINPATMVHSHPIKSIPEFDSAIESGLEMFVVDNPDEINKFRRYSNKKLKVLIRYRINTNTIAVVNLQYKFGCAVEDVLRLACMIKETGHEFYGLCFHIGSQCIFAENYVRAIETAHELIRELDEAGFKTRILDIGGGFPVEYVEPIPEIEEFCTPINYALDQHIKPEIRILSEPGRYISANTVTLVSTIIGKACRNGKIWYYLNDGLYSTFSGIVFDHCQYPVINNRNSEEKLSVLAGPTCDSFDVMYDGLMMPEHEVGDRIIFTATGAYCSVSGSNFNALKRPEYIVID